MKIPLICYRSGTAATILVLLAPFWYCLLSHCFAGFATAGAGFATAATILVLLAVAILITPPFSFLPPILVAGVVRAILTTTKVSMKREYHASGICQKRGKDMAKKQKFKHVELREIVGKTILKIGHGKVEAAFDDEPCTMLYFTDGTKHGFVHPAPSGF